MLCGQCGTSADRCERCGGALCPRRLCAEVHEAACDAAATLPTAPMLGASLPISGVVYKARPRPRRQRDPETERLLAEQLVMQITKRRHTGRGALLAGDLN